MCEQWRDVVGYEGRYQVSDLGNVRAPAKVNSRGHILKAKTIRPAPVNKLGHLNFSAYKLGQRSCLLVHQEVLKAFVGPRPEGFDGCHKDDVPTNNKLTNLKWASRSENLGGDRNKNRKYSSKYNGVSWLSANKKWRSQVTTQGHRRVYLGLFRCEHEAAKAFNNYCVEHGLEIHLNKIEVLT